MSRQLFEAAVVYCTQWISVCMVQRSFVMQVTIAVATVMNERVCLVRSAQDALTVII